MTEETACTDPNSWQGPGIPCTPELCTPSGVDDGPLATTLGFRVAPTPFAEKTALVFAGPKGTEASLLIFDVSGRRVRSAWQGVLTGRTITMEWDGRDDWGGKHPPGSMGPSAERSRGRGCKAREGAVAGLPLTPWNGRDDGGRSTCRFPPVNRLEWPVLASR